MYGFEISWPTVLIMSAIWLLLFFIYIKMHKRTTGGFIDRILAGKYNDMILQFGRNVIKQNPDLIWTIVKQFFMKEEKPGEYRLNDKTRLLFIQLINEGLVYMDHSMQGQYGKLVQMGDIPNVSALAEMSPQTLIKGQKMMGKWKPVIMKGLEVLDKLGGLKDQFEKAKEKGE